MPAFIDGPASSLFRPVPLTGGSALASLSVPGAGVTAELQRLLPGAPDGACVCHGIPFDAARIVVLNGAPVTVGLAGLKARWLVFLHTSDIRPLEINRHGFHSPMRGEGQLGEQACTYRVRYGDGAEAELAIRRRFHIGSVTRRWGESCFEAVAHAKPRPMRLPHEQLRGDWGHAQTRVDPADLDGWVSWLWAWENPLPEKALDSVRLEPSAGVVVLSGISAGMTSSNPLRWETRRKALLFTGGAGFSFDLDERGLLRSIQIDLGQVISASPRPLYPNERWEASYNNQVPEAAASEVLVEYTAHPEASFHLGGGKQLPVADLAHAARRAGAAASLEPVPSSSRRVRLRVVEKGGGRPVPVKLHVHGQAGEYLAPLDRHRIPNAAWYEDYSVDFVHQGAHRCTYIAGATTIDMPLGTIYLEVSKGFEIRPVRKRVQVDAGTEEILVELDRVLPWREKGWVTADTHVHFLSPGSALLEGNAEGINVVNLLASQWGELMTNVGDFDGKTTWGSREAGGDGEHLVRVGTENRQHVLGHISLLGYNGAIIAPMTTGGPDESALGDPIEILLSEWAEACKAKGGIVVLPHFPQPRGENAAAIVAGRIDAVEMTSWGDLYGGISPYSLSDWYRYLSCGYMVAAVGGTDKMSADTAVGTVRTYARIPDGQPFTYEEWKRAVRRGETFVTYGPLLELAVDGKPMGSRMQLPASGERSTSRGRRRA